LSNYKRMISYMYQYVKGEKTKNVGYARIELRNGNLKITIHLHLQGYGDGIFPTYLIQRANDNLELIYCGDSILKNQIIDSKLSSQDTNIMESGYNFSDIGGILLFLNDEVFFATEWDDKPIILREVMQALRPKDEQPSLKFKVVKDIEGKITGDVEEKVDNLEATLAEDVREAKVDTNISNEAELEEKNEDKIVDLSKVKKGSVVTDLAEASKLSQVAELEEVKKESMIADLSEDNKQTKVANTYVDLGRAPMAWSKVWPYKAPKAMDTYKLRAGEATPKYQLPKKPVLGRSYMEEQAETDNKGKEPIKAAGVLQDIKMPKVSENGAKDQEQADNPTAEYIFKKYQRIYPFEDNEIIISVKIEPKDIGYLPKEVWTLSGNSFLLHGYYCYNHLIFAKMKGRTGYQYILGVPGIYHNKELYMAKMFGFYNFKSIRKRELRQGDFGYWYIIIDM